ncbi:dynein axonemal intermediate chain 3 isoform 3-T8 [Amazona ochrocephala]
MSQAKAKKQKGENKAKKSPKGKEPDEKDEVDLSMASIGHPEIFPLVLTTQTQAIFNCRVDEDVTEENCFKIIKKEDVIQDLKRRAKISDFYPIKNVILEYPGEELLVVLDANFQYGQNFYLVASEEAKENLLKPPETAEEKQEEIEEEVENTVEALEIQPYRPPVQKPWVSLGSEKEVEEESVKDTVTKIKYMISRVRRKFGAPITFTDSNASDVKDSYVECTSYQDKTFSIKMLEKDVGVQMVPKVKESSTQTKWTYPKNAATQYFPRELSDEEKEDYLSSEKLKEFLTSVHLRMEIALQQNEIMNPFFDDWKALAEDESSSGGKPDVYLQAYQSFTDLRYPKDRTISCVCWHPNIDGVIAVSARQRLSYEEHINLSDKSLLQQSTILFWSVSDPIQPQLLLECPEDIYCFQFSPSNPSIIAGGCINGQVILWDISEHEDKLQNTKTDADVNDVTAPPAMEDQQSSTEPPLVKHCAASPIEHAHKKPVTDIIWLLNYFEDNQTGADSENRAEMPMQFATCSPDCSILFWDIPDPKLSEQPLSKKETEMNMFYKPRGGPDTSKHLDLSWKPLIKINLCKSGITQEYGSTRIILRVLHCNFKSSERVSARERSRSLKGIKDISTDFFVGTEDGEIIYSDWKIEIENDLPIPVNQKHTQKYTVHTETINTLQRSPFFKDIVLSIGGRKFAIWKEEVTNISKSKITFISPWIAPSKQHFLAVSDDLGVLHVLEICQALSDPLMNEHDSILDYFEREVKYLKYCEQEIQEYQDLQAKTEKKSIWKHKGRKQV